MNSLNGVTKTLVEENIEHQILELDALVERLDFLDIQILRKFYMTGESYPFNSQPYCFPILYMEMKKSKQINIGMEALRKRLNGLVKLGLLEKIKHSNPTNYTPVQGKEEMVKSIINRFLLIHGLPKFL